VRDGGAVVGIGKVENMKWKKRKIGHGYLWMTERMAVLY
jgi:hypothetical protein